MKKIKLIGIWHILNKKFGNDITSKYQVCKCLRIAIKNVKQGDLVQNDA